MRKKIVAISSRSIDHTNTEMLSLLAADKITMRDEETQDGLKEITVRKDKHYSDKHYGKQMRKIARNQSVLCIEKTKTTKGIELIMIVEKNRRKEQIVSKTE